MRKTCSFIRVFIRDFIRSFIRDFIRSFIRVWVKYKKEHLENHYNMFSSQRKMNCLHGQPAATSTTQNGSFWFCNQNPSCNFFCSEDEGYLFEKAIDAWKSTKQTHPKCTKHQKLAKMRVVKDLMKPNYGRPFFVCSDKAKPCSFWVWGDVEIPSYETSEIIETSRK
jgi:hypothetical protein